MIIYYNGKEKSIPEGASVGDLLAALKLQGPVVVELNRAIIEEDAYPNTVLHQQDRVELIRFVGGG